MKCGGDDSAGGTCAGAGAVLGEFEQHSGGIFDGFKACGAHAEEADLEGVAEAVFGAADDAVVVVGIAFEVEDGVDDVFHEFGAGEEAFFGDVADEADGGAGGFGEIDELGAAIAELGDAAGGAGVVGAVDHLDGVDDAEGGLDAAEGGRDSFEVGFSEDLEGGVLFAGDAETLGAKLGLLGGFFGGHIEDTFAVGGEMGEGLEEERGFADAGLTTEEDGAAGDDAAAEDAVEFRDTDGDAGDFERGDLVDGEGPAGAFDVFTGLRG